MSNLWPFWSLISFESCFIAVFHLKCCLPACCFIFGTDIFRLSFNSFLLPQPSQCLDYSLQWFLCPMSWFIFSESLYASCIKFILWHLAVGFQINSIRNMVGLFSIKENSQQRREKLFQDFIVNTQLDQIWNFPYYPQFLWFCDTSWAFVLWMSVEINYISRVFMLDSHYQNRSEMWNLQHCLFCSLFFLEGSFLNCYWKLSLNVLLVKFCL